jgi:hypothetical protein
MVMEFQNLRVMPEAYGMGPCFRRDDGRKDDGRRDDGRGDDGRRDDDPNV